MTRLSGFLLACIFFLSGCIFEEPDVIDDSGFDLWCDGELCAWQTEEGSIRRVATWHEKDYGVELSATPTALSQRLDIRDECIAFRILADIESTADVTLELDVSGDGSIDHVESLPALRWTPLDLLARLPPSAASLRLVLRKRGEGKAVVAELSAEFSASCPNAPIQVSSALGAVCVVGDSCASGYCAFTAPLSRGPRVCSECETDEHCEDGLICGQVQAGMVRMACVAPGSIPSGRACNRNEECEGAWCDRGVCAQAPP